MATCTDDNNMTKETTDNIKKLTAMTKLETKQKEEFMNLLKQYPIYLHTMIMTLVIQQL